MTHISDVVPATQGRDEGEGRTSLAVALERLLSAGIGITAWAIGRSEHAASLTMVQWRLLVIAGARQEPRVGELAAHLGISVPSASRLIRRLEMRGLVETARAEGDRRATIVTLTSRGRELVDDVMAQRRELIGQALHDRPRGGEDVAVVAIDELAVRMSEFA